MDIPDSLPNKRLEKRLEIPRKARNLKRLSLAVGSKEMCNLKPEDIFDALQKHINSLPQDQQTMCHINHLWGYVNVLVQEHYQRKHFWRGVLTSIFCIALGAFLKSVL